MDSFLLCLVMTFAIAFGGREQLIVAQFSESLERGLPLLVTGAFCALLSAAIMAYAGSSLAAILPPRAAAMLVAFALMIAAFELIWPVKLKAMAEPTRSLIAIGIVVLARQVGDAARFVIFAFAAQATYPATALIGGAIGGIAAAALGWSLGLSRLSQFPLRAIRSVMGGGLIVAAIVIGLNARFMFL
ncbi:hypothetical protein [Qipengyuania sp. ASV99]|uniref:hypothetical protein n=1 Tax=Qipengyuania sp. ASV99 TaxID=3399681 RepID=UPI003A4C7351